MSNTDETPIVNDTIINMITNLKPRITSEYPQLEPSRSNSQKRSLSLSGDSSSEQSTPLKKQRFERLNTNYMASPREIRRLKSDLMQERNKNLNLENRIKHMHNVRKELQQMFESETADLRQQHELDRESIERVCILHCSR